MSERMSTLLGWIEAHEAQHMSEQAILARRESEWEARHAKTLGVACPESNAATQGIRWRLAWIRDALLGGSGRTVERLD